MSAIRWLVFSSALALPALAEGPPAEVVAETAPPAPAPVPRVSLEADERLLAVEPRRVSIGAAAGALYGLAPRPLARGQLFVDLDPFWASLSSKLSARVGLVGALGSASTRVGSVRSSLLGGYVEGCPWPLTKARFSVRPCLGFELGAKHAGGAGFSESTLWAGPGAGLRGSAALPLELGLEASAGIQVPLSRNEVFAGPSSLYRAELVLFQASLGISIELP